MQSGFLIASLLFTVVFVSSLSIPNENPGSTVNTLVDVQTSNSEAEESKPRIKRQFGFGWFDDRDRRFGDRGVLIVLQQI